MGMQSHILAKIAISIGAHKEICVTAGVSKTLPAAVLLDHDVPELMVLFAETKTAVLAEPDLAGPRPTGSERRRPRRNE